MFDRSLGNGQVLAEYGEHGLVAIPIGVEAIAQAQRFTLIVEYADICHAAALEHSEQAVGHDVIQRGQLAVLGAAAHQLEHFHGAIVGQEEIVAVVAPMHFGGLAHQIVDFFACEFQRHRGDATQLGLGVFVDDLGQRQDE
ncbi:hypothetical protein D3C81_1463940 [compost metagenome]